MDDLLEYDECILLSEYLDFLQRQGRVLRYTHVPNETWTNSFNQKVRNKRQGVRKGFPDYIILFPKQIIFLEMKRRKGGKVSDEQREWLNDLVKVGYIAEVCNGFEEAEMIIKKYI